MHDHKIKETILEKGFFYLTEGELDVHLFHEGTNYKSYNFFGAHPIIKYNMDSVRFVV